MFSLLIFGYWMNVLLSSLYRNKPLPHKANQTLPFESRYASLMSMLKGLLKFILSKVFDSGKYLYIPLAVASHKKSFRVGIILFIYVLFISGRFILVMLLVCFSHLFNPLSDPIHMNFSSSAKLIMALFVSKSGYSIEFLYTR